MAIGLLISSRFELENYLRFAYEIALLIDQPLLAVCSSQDDKKDDGETLIEAARTVVNGPLARDYCSADIAVRTFFTLPKSKSPQTSRGIGEEVDGLSGFVDFVELDGEFDDRQFRSWLRQPRFSKVLGTYTIEKLILPVEDAIDGKPKMLADKNLQVIFQSDIEVIVARFGKRLNDVEYAGVTPLIVQRSTTFSALRLARTLSKNRKLEIRRNAAHEIAYDLDGQLDCILTEIKSKDDFEANSVWASLSPSSFGILIAIKPADGIADRLSDLFDDLATRWFPENQMTREQRNELATELYSSVERWPQPEFLILMVFASVLAAIGLLQDSSAVIIGAMLVAPLMSPLLTSGLSLVHGNWPKFVQASVTAMSGFGMAFVVGMLAGCAALWLPEASPASLPSAGIHGAEFWNAGKDQILARTMPSLLDAVIGFVAGLAAGFLIGRQDKPISTLAGTAIAAALVPPIVTAGLQATLCFIGHNIVLDLDGKAPVYLVAFPTLLFLLNAIAIILGSYCGLRVVGMHKTRYPRETKPWRTPVMIAGTIALAGIWGLLWYHYYVAG